ncbi:RNA exonuclease 1 -like protein [Halotydeus destructor]|nr:RNA exonuclease 1 -like protein [Halotydeus destructor]
MLSSAGFFSDLLCPFFKAGQCERPYCHFKHSLPKANLSTSTSGYVPTPIDKLKKLHGSKAVSKNGSSPATGPAPPMAVYTPTPISELKKLKDIVKKRKSEEEEPKSKKSKTEVKPAVKATELKRKEPVEEPKKSPVEVTKVKTKVLATTTIKSEGSKQRSPSKSVPIKLESDATKESQTAAKARVAHTKPETAPTARRSKLTAAEVMFSRFKAKKASSDKESDSDSLSSSETLAKKRVAHSIKPDIMQNAASKRPTMPLNHGGGKVPLGVRQKYLSMLIDECLKVSGVKEDAFERGLKEEKTVYEKSKSRIVYTSMAVGVIKRLRNESGSVRKSSSSTMIKGNRVVSHEQMLNGPNSANCSIKKTHKVLKVEDLTDVMMYSCLKKYVMSQSKLIEYGYPIMSPDAEGTVILPIDDAKTLNDFKNTRRVCFRCKKSFHVDEEGIPLQKEACNYHNGRLWNMRSRGLTDRKYSCCQGDLSAGGCSSADSHVVDGYGHPEYCRGYVQTKPRKISPESSPGVFALDCEMCCTTIGIELTRVSILDTKSKVVYEQLVKPANPVLDYNTKFSGINEGDLDDVKTTLEDVQKQLLKLFNESTILIGHSLESDLKALKLVHSTVIDTAEMFPHKKGLPFKRALRTLVAENLLKIIQDGVSGHDSQEDAKSCLQLVLMKIGNDLAKLKPKS